MVATGSGSLDTTDLSLVGSGVGSCFGADALFALACVGPHSLDIDNYRGFVGPLSFGTGSPTFLDSSGSGDFTGIIGRTGFLDLPGGYVSETMLLGDAFFANSDFQDMGLTPGTYVWSWGTGPDADTFTVQIGVPEPSTWALPARGIWRPRTGRIPPGSKGPGDRLMQLGAVALVARRHLYYATSLSIQAHVRLLSRSGRQPDRDRLLPRPVGRRAPTIVPPEP